MIYKWFKPENNYAHGYIKVMLRNVPVNPSISLEFPVFPGIPSISRRPGKF